MKIYIDTSALNRIFDDQSQPRIYEELKVDYFLTCDDKMLKRYKGPIKLQSPVDFVTNILKKEQTNDS